MPEKKTTEIPKRSAKTTKAEFPSINRWGPETQENKRYCSATGEFKLEYPFFRNGLFYPHSLEFDHTNIPIETDRNTQKQYYNPELVACYGLSQLSLFLEEGEIPARYDALRMADWLIEHLTEWRKHIFAWPCEKDFPLYRIKSPWISAKSHSLALSLLLRVAYLNNDASYEEAAQKIIRLYFLPVNEGGLVRQLPNGGLAFEEFPVSEQSLPLSGYLYSLISLSEYVKFFDDYDVQTMLRGGLRGLKKYLSKYDLGKWLLYDLHPSRRLASPEEISKNCILLKILSELTEDKEYATVAQKWFKYKETSACKRYYFFQKLWGKFRLRFRAKKYGIDIKYLKVVPL